MAVVRGLSHLVTEEDGPGVRALVRPADEDMFRYGPRDVVFARQTIKGVSGQPWTSAAVRRAVAAGIALSRCTDTTPWRFVLSSSAQTKVKLLDAMRDAWIADLRADGFTEESITKRVRRGDVLRNAPYLVVPCLVMEGSHTYRDERRNASEREMFIVATGAGVENFLIQLAVEGLGGLPLMMVPAARWCVRCSTCRSCASHGSALLRWATRWPCPGTVRPAIRRKSPIP